MFPSSSELHVRNRQTLRRRTIFRGQMSQGAVLMVNGMGDGVVVFIHVRNERRQPRLARHQYRLFRNYNICDCSLIIGVQTDLADRRYWPDE